MAGPLLGGRRVLYLLLGVVAAAAAVLSFAALRDLALLCGFAPNLAWLLPVVVDAGAAAGSLVWLAGRVTRAARRFARALALALLMLSVAANALGHGLEAFALDPPWWVVVIVAAIAPAVLGAVVHLAVLVGHPDAAAGAVLAAVPAGVAEPGAGSSTGEPGPVHQPLTEHAHEPLVEHVHEPHDRNVHEPHPEHVETTAARRRGATGRGTAGGGRPRRRLLAEFVAAARTALDTARAHDRAVDPTPSWVREVTGCSAGTSVKVAAALRTPTDSAAADLAAVDGAGVDRAEVAA